MRPREAIEKDIRLAEQELAMAEDDVERAKDRLAELDDELASLPPDGGDDELWYAARDPRQIPLFGEGHASHD